MSDKKSCIVDRYLFTYDCTVQANIFSCESYYGVSFNMNDGRYEVIHNYHMGNRLIINPKDGRFEDVPFKPDTFWLLPPEIEVEEI